MPRISVVRTDRLSSATFDDMWTLYKQSHDVDRDTFERKTMEKFQHLALLRHGGDVIGFSGADGHVVETPSGKKYFAQYQGQAMLDPRWRKTGWAAMGPIVLGLDGVRRAKRLPFVLWQDAVTVRTFMLVAKYAPAYFPHPSLEMPAELRELRDVLGQQRYGSSYCAERGIVLKDARMVTEENIDPARLSNPHIRFYAEANPGYVHGNGLLQLSPLGAKEFARAGGMAMRNMLRRRR